PAETQPAATRPATAPAGRAGPADKVSPEKAAADKIAEQQKAQEEQQLRVRRTSRDAQLKQLADRASVERDGPLERHVRLGLDRGALRLEASVSADGPAIGNGSYFRVKGTNAAWSISRYGTQAQPSVRVSRSELTPPADDDGVYSLYAMASGSTLTLSGTSVARHVSFTQNLSPARPVRAGFVGAVQPQPYTITINEYGGRNGGIRNARSMTAKSLPELRMKFPAEFRKFVVPLLAKLADPSILSPGAADAYGAFDDVPADAAVSAKLAELLHGLDAEEFAVREQAAKQLRELGPAGVLAALRWDRAALSDEQVGQLGRYVAEYRRLNLADAEAARHDPGFLADCLEHADPLVRASARRHLEQVLGKPVAFDPTLTGEALSAAADAVRMTINAWANPEAAPATQPAAGEQPAPVAPAVGPQPARIILR
ncbi:MAG TPA: hypothetical protein VF796_03840, partial [Humisphaera sp.]